MTSNRTSVIAFLDALELREPAGIRELLADDVVEILPLAASGTLGPAVSWAGKTDVMRVQQVIIDAFDTIAFQERKITVSSNGDVVFVEAVGRRVQHGTGRLYENVYVVKFEFRDGLIERIVEYSNPVAFAKFFDQPIG